MFLLIDSKDEVVTAYKRPIDRSEDAIASSREIFISFAEETTERLHGCHILARDKGRSYIMSTSWVV